MIIFYAIFLVISLIFGLNSLINEQDGITAIHMFILSLYFLLTIYEVYGKPFHLRYYYLVLFLLIVNGSFQLFFLQSFIHGIISFLFAFSAWQSIKRLRLS